MGYFISREVEGRYSHQLFLTSTSKMQQVIGVLFVVLFAGSCQGAPRPAANNLVFHDSQVCGPSAYLPNRNPQSIGDAMQQCEAMDDCSAIMAISWLDSLVG